MSMLCANMHDLYVCAAYNRCGSVMRYWCMRYEAKHSYFKDLAQKIKCFKNIPKSPAERHQHQHQRLVCYHFIDHNHWLKRSKLEKVHFLLHEHRHAHYHVHTCTTHTCPNNLVPPPPPTHTHTRTSGGSSYGSMEPPFLVS